MENQEEVADRIKRYYEIEEETWSSVEDLGQGIWVYHDVIPKDLRVIERLEEVILDKTNYYDFREAMVGYGMKMPEYRDCYDFKFKKTDIERDLSPASKKLQSIWDDVYYRELQAVKHYSKSFNIGELRYWESMNFVKYETGQHFQEHHDNGYSYNCILSSVAYPNDDYEGGELQFRLQNLTVKPKAGDLFLFPSNFMYPHKAMTVTSGTKYSIVTMLDFSDKYHRPEFYRETNS